MSFRERSAWGMASIMLITGGAYWYLAGGARHISLMGLAIWWVLLVTILSVALQILLALTSPDEARRGPDEREILATTRAGRSAGMVLTTGIVLSAGLYLFKSDGLLLFHHAIASLIVAQLVDYGLQIIMLRRSV